MGVAPRQLAFGLVGEAAPQQLGDDEAEHPVAEEFEPLVAAPAAAAPAHRARMGQRLGQQGLVREFVAEALGQRQRRRSRFVHLSELP